jgi:CRP/FNR family cyclic AMP-dependent transcriptional regulator
VLRQIAATPAPRALSFGPGSFLSKMTAGQSTREYRVSQRVFTQGDPADAVFYVQRGKVKLSVRSPRGKEAIIGVLGRGTFFGESCLAVQPLRMSTARALQSSTIVRVDKKTMMALLHREPVFAELFLAYMLSRNLRIEEDLIHQLFNSCEKRLARILLLLARFGKKSKPEAVTPNMSQESLASMVGTTRARVSCFMNRFRKMGFIDYDGGGLKVHRGLLTVLLHD